MIGIVEGTLLTSKLKQPENGQEFKPHQLLGLVQINDSEPEIVKIKDFDLRRTHKTNAPAKIKCTIKHWSNSSMSGQSVTLLDVL